MRISVRWISSGGVVAGYANQRQLELLVEEGFTPLEAIRIGTLNGATYLGRDARIGSIAVGKQADLVVVNGNETGGNGQVHAAERTNQDTRLASRFLTGLVKTRAIHAGIGAPSAWLRAR